jgi:hypothetical protein
MQEFIRNRGLCLLYAHQGFVLDPLGALRQLQNLLPSTAFPLSEILVSVTACRWNGEPFGPVKYINVMQFSQITYING